MPAMLLLPIVGNMALRELSVLGDLQWNSQKPLVKIRFKTKKTVGQSHAQHGPGRLISLQFFLREEKYANKNLETKTAAKYA
jgi:hypothetical protein